MFDSSGFGYTVVCGNDNVEEKISGVSAIAAAEANNLNTTELWTVIQCIKAHLGYNWTYVARGKEGPVPKVPHIGERPTDKGYFKRWACW